MCTAVALATSASTASAQARRSIGQVQDTANLFNWYYGTAFGSGYYRIDGAQSLVVRVPLAYRLREATAGQWNVRLVAPVTAGLVSSDGEGIVPDTLTMLSGSVGVEVEVPFAERLRVKPFATIGVGREFRVDSNAKISVLGVKARYRLPVTGHEVDVGGSVVGSRVWTRTDRDTLGQTALGLDWVTPLALDLHGTARISVSLIQYWYFDDAAFLLPNGEVRSITRETEYGVALRPTRPWNVFGFEVDRLGVGVRLGPNVWGVQLVTSFPF